MPGLLLAMGQNEQLRNRLWEGFSAPAVALFTADASDPADAERDARAVIAMAAGAAACESATKPPHPRPQR